MRQQIAPPAEVIDWIETELMDEINFRDIPEILAEARERFCGNSFAQTVTTASSD